MLRLGLFLRLDATGRQVAQISAEGRLAVACVIGGEDGRQLFLCAAATTLQGLVRGISIGLIHRLTVDSTGQDWP